MVTSSPITDVNKKGILKSKSGCVGLFPVDLNSELKLRLKKSTHASVSNLKKSATSILDGQTPTTSFSSSPSTYGLKSSLRHDNSNEDGSSEYDADDYKLRSHRRCETSSSESEDDCEPGKNLAKILRSVSKATNAAAVAKQTESDNNHILNQKTVMKNFSNVDRKFDNLKTDENKLSSRAAIDGEGSYRRDTAAHMMSKNNAVARRRKFLDG